MRKISKNLLFIVVTLMIVASSCGEKEEKILRLNIPKEEVEEFELLPDADYHLNGGKTSNQETIQEIVDQLNQIEFRSRRKEKEAVAGGICYTFIIKYKNKEQSKYHIYNGEIWMPDGSRQEIISQDYPNASYIADLLGIKRRAEFGRIWDPDKTGVKLEYFPLTEASEYGVTEDKEQIRTILDRLNMYSCLECQNYKSDYDSPTGYFTVTCEDGTVLKYEISGFYVHCPDGIWLERIDRSLRITSYLSQELGFRCTDPNVG
ncbi:MAG: hypothetical protein KIC77_06060 [Clostridiales bacterium]|nr:hypothetical protein [Clostridiales bacterium]